MERRKEEKIGRKSLVRLGLEWEGETVLLDKKTGSSNQWVGAWGCGIKGKRSDEKKTSI